MRTSSQLSQITQSGLAPFPGCQGPCGIVPNGPAGSVASFSICQGLKCQHVTSTLTSTMWLLCSFFEPLSKVAATFVRKMWQFFWCILAERHITPAMLSPGPKDLCWISGKLRKCLKSLAGFLSALAFLCCHYILAMSPAWLLALILYICTCIHTNFWYVYSLEQYVFRPHSNLF